MMKTGVDHYRDLKIWQKGMEVVNAIYAFTKKFPDEEKYGLVTQMRRAAVSIPSNIAEGFRRNHSKEFKQFLAVARGSIAELETQLIISSNQGYINSSEELMSDLDALSRMTVSFASQLR